MREITTHKVNGCNEAIAITADEPGPGGASHYYELRWPDGQSPGHEASLGLSFQNGPIGEVGTNGITQEALLAVVADRLRSFQAGPYACPENAAALAKIEEAIGSLHSRTLARVARGVEGTHQK